MTKRYSKRKERRACRKATKIYDKLKRTEAVNILVVALGEAIWMEGGNEADMTATMDIAHHVICGCLSDRFNRLSEGHKQHGNVIPFKRRKSYMQKVKRWPDAS